MKKIISNLNGYNEQYIPIFPENGEIRKVAKEILKPLEELNSIYFFQVITLGRRILNNKSKEECINLINGKKPRIYLIFKINKKIIIKFAWYKIKFFNLSEKKFALENWHINFFNNEGKFLVKQLNGIVFPEFILNKYII